MSSIFPKYLFLITVLAYLSCGNNSEPKKSATNKHDIKNEIVIIFKKNNKAETINEFQTPIYYSENNEYIVKEISVNNNVKDDTIKLLSIKDKICLTHNFKDNTTFMYEFEKGDTITFDYSKNLPYAHVVNRKSLKYDLNFQVDFKMEKPLGDFEFFSKFKRIRSADEKTKNIL